MFDLQDYRFSLLAIGLILVLVIVQWVVATVSKGRLPDAVPGYPPKDQNHHSFVFRAYRTHQNTLENLGLMLGGGFFAILAGANPSWVTGLLFTILIARVIHMILYYVIGTERNPSPRSYFFIIGWLANVVLVGMGIFALF
ncbi:hypothetical protein GEMRC1_007983 [Eukaryota sp. GEM-RC1]